MRQTSLTTMTACLAGGSSGRGEIHWPRKSRCRESQYSRDPDVACICVLCAAAGDGEEQQLLCVYPATR